MNLDAALPSAGPAPAPQEPASSSAAAPTRADPPVAQVVDRLDELERELLHERFSEFERAVLQDNIVLCDQKSGVLLAFSGALVILSLDALADPISGGRLGAWAGYLGHGAFGLAAAAFLVSCVYGLATVNPRLRRAPTENHIFWESTVFKLSASQYVNAMNLLTPEVEREEKLRHLHTLAGICRAKYANFRRGIRFALLGFGGLVVAELIKAAV